MADAANDPYFYRSFLSYSTDPDYDLARTVERYIESFHLRAGIRRLGLARLEICRDGSDFKLPPQRGDKPVGPGSGIRAILDGYLDQSMYLIVLCSRHAPSSPYVKYEIEHFLQNHPSDAVLAVITEGENPSQKPEEVFPPELVAAGVHEKPWYDLRAHRAKQNRTWRGVRDFEEELVRLAAHLHDDSAGRIYPAWQRAEERKRKARIASAVCAILLVLGLIGVYLWTRTDRYLMARIYKEAAPLSDLAAFPFARSYLPALTCSSSEENALRAADRVPRNRPEGLAAIAVVLAKSDQPREALKVAKEIAAIQDTPRENTSPFRGGYMGQVAQALAQTQHPAEALEVLEQVESPGARAQYLAKVAPIAKAGPTGRRLAALIDRTIEETRRLKNPPPGYQIAHLASALASAGRVDEGRQLAQDLDQSTLLAQGPDPYHASQLLVEAAEAMAVPELKEEVAPLAKAAIESARRIGPNADQWGYLRRIGSTYAQIGAPGDAVRLAEGMAQAPATLDRDDALTGIALALIDTHDFDQALRVLRLEQAGSSTDALVELAAQLTAVRDPGPIIAAVPGIESPRFIDTRAYDLARFAAALSAAGMTPAASQVADTALNLTGQVTHPGEKAYILAFLAAAYAGAGRAAAARTSLQQALLALGNETEPQTKSVVYLRLAQALCRLHAYHEAHDLANQCWRPEDKLQAYASILRAYAVERNLQLSAACGE